MTRQLPRTALASLLAAFALHAQAAVDLDAKVPIGPQVKVGHLPNGLTYYIHKNSKPEKKAELRLVVKAGSILEDEDQQGLAHFTEHMAFNGSTHFKKHELISYLQSIGVKFGADLNAYTSFDETVYILPIPTDHKANLERGLTVLEDWAGGLSFKDADIDKERDIVLEEARLGKGAGDRMNRQLLPKMFNGSRYSERLPIGKEDTLRTFKPDSLRRFYKDWYRPDLMAVIAVGDFDPAQVEKLIKQHFSKLKNPAHERPREYAKVAPRADSEGVVITDKEATSTSLYIRYPVRPWQDDGSYREYRLSLVEQLFETMLNQRLAELAQQANPPFVGGGSADGKLVRGYKSYSSLAVLGRGGAQPAIEALVQENERARQFGFTAAELDRARKNMMRGFERAYVERDKTDSGSYAGEYIRNFLEQEPVPGIAAEYKIAQELLPGITLDEMNRYARETVPAPSAPKLVAYLGPDKAETPIPSSGELLAAVDQAAQNKVAAHTESAVGAKLMETPPKPGTITGETHDAALGTTTLTLSNGVKVILKPTDFRNDQVLLSAVRFGGQTLFDDKDVFNARYANAVVATMGVDGHSPIELQKILAGQAAAVRFNMASYTDNISASAGSTDVETMLQLLYLHFTKLRKDGNLYQSFIGRQQDLARNALSQPESQFRDAIYSTLYNNNPRVGLTARPEDFSKIDMDRAVDIFAQRFGSAKGLTFVMVGSFDPAKVKPLLATYLASLPTPDIPLQFKDIGIRPVQGVVKKEVHAGSEPKATVSMTFTGTMPYSDEEQMRFHAMLEVMNIRITDVLREKLTLIYGGGLSGSFSQYPYANYAISGGLPCGPENVDKVIDAVLGLIAQLKDKGPDVADLNKVKQNWLQNHAKALRENDYWMGRIQNSLLNGTDPHTLLRYTEMVNAITPADIQAAAQRYFNLQNYVQVVLKPETASPAPAAPVAAAAAPR